jgi:uncharacterized membrane protein YdjX (TVP38/TMEM64 family)
VKKTVFGFFKYSSIVIIGATGGTTVLFRGGGRLTEGNVGIEGNTEVIV